MSQHLRTMFSSDWHPDARLKIRHALSGRYVCLPGVATPENDYTLPLHKFYVRNLAGVFVTMIQEDGELEKPAVLCTSVVTGGGGIAPPSFSLEDCASPDGISHNWVVMIFTGTRPTMATSTLTELMRLGVGSFAKVCFNDKLLNNLQGTPCQGRACIGGTGKYAKYPSKLGKLRLLKADHLGDLTSELAHYRCLRCRGRFAINHGSTIFPPKRAGGSVSLTDTIIAFWHCVHDSSILLCCKEIGRSEQVVRGFYDQAREIMAADAMRRESEIVFGELLGNKTTDFEPDESSFASWQEEQEDGSILCKFYVWLGVVQRGSPEKLFLHEVGVTESREIARLPPLSGELWRATCRRIFTKDSRMVCMSDSAQAYTSKPWPVGIVDAHHVNHSQKPCPEFARSVMALSNVETRATRPAIASTCLIDAI